MDKNKSQLLVIDGGVVKTTAEGLVEGLGIVFGSEIEPDQSKERDFFTSDSFIQKKGKFTVPLFYEHGLGANEEQIGEATLTKTNDGWHAQAEIDTSTEAGQLVYEEVKTSPHGFSTGAMQHLVRREPKKNNTNYLSKWVVGELSLTKRPAERKAVVQAVKSLDGEAIYEDAFQEPTIPEAKTSDIVVTALYAADGEKIWSIEGTEEFPADATPKSMDVKYAAGSVTYTLYTGEEDTSMDFNVVQYGDPASVINQLQGILNKAAQAVKEATPPEEVDFEARVKAVVNTVIKNNTDDKIVELQTALDDKETEITELKSKVEESDTALKIAQEKIANLSILAGAKETINKYKGK